MSHKHNRKRIRSRSRARSNQYYNSTIGTVSIGQTYRNVQRPLDWTQTRSPQRLRDPGMPTATKHDPQWYHARAHGYAATMQLDHCTPKQEKTSGINPEDIVRFLFDGSLDYSEDPV